MTKRWEDNFEALLAWLDPDRERAGEKYEDIRHSLIQIFSWRGCSDAEDLADETITRVTNRISEVAPNYKGDPALYFYGVAKKMVLEATRREPDVELPVSDILEDPRTEEPEVARHESDAEHNSEIVYECLNDCLGKLSDNDRELVLLYHLHEQPKIKSRRELARRLNIDSNNLRVKVHRIRARLHKCIDDCLRQKTASETD